MGKTAVGVSIAGAQLLAGAISSCMIIVPKIALKNQWLAEFELWGYPTEGIEFMECVNTAYKNDYKVDLLILDEVHKYVGPEFRHVFTINCTQMLGLTATEPEDEDSVIETNCPVVYKKTLTEARKLDAVSDFTIINYLVPLLDKKEKRMYNTFDKQYKLAMLQLLELRASRVQFSYMNIFDMAKMFMTIGLSGCSKYIDPTHYEEDIAYFKDVIRWSKAY